MPIAEGGWNKQLASDSMKNVWMKLKDLRPAFRKLNNRDFKGISDRITTARASLRNIQEIISITYTNDLADEELEILQQLEKWSLIEEKALHQKSKATWIRLGDTNTKYFSVVMKERQQRKQITVLTSLFGTRLTEPPDIQREIILFYKSLTGTATTTLDVVNMNTMKKGSTLSHSQKIALCTDVTA
ncbi:hypothetical protein K7X08_004672 [Anisodus acutangulus]|uniref:Uncharacterized protein n=1 Tax=Anisodus acutangulus TaxID=402998 RepID=A0A9Q1ME19_9SOLA|nr:hypothetical protein K7X08_004672 [Anisodus acutangulus]